MLALVQAAAVSAQGIYPFRAVRFVIGFPPGSAADVVVRVLAAKLGESTGQSFVVDNRPGAGSNIAADLAAHAPADGYTIFLGSIANTINATLYKKLPFEFLRDFSAVSGVSSLPNLLVVHPSLPARSVKELITFAKKHPGEILYASAGNGTSPHLSGVLFDSMAKVKMVHVPYKGSPLAVADLVAGRVHIMFSPISTALPQVNANKLRALATTTARRPAVAAHLPTVAEAGLPGFETSIWFGLVVPARTPKDIIERLNQETVRALADADLRKRYAVLGIETMGGTPEALSKLMRDETAKWGRVVKAAGVQID
jgi:tripartite-type tricarboxylate transporter receptor subunit TctC